MTWDDFTTTEKKWLFGSILLAVGVFLFGLLPLNEQFLFAIKLLGLSEVTIGLVYFTVLIGKNRRIPRLFVVQSCVLCLICLWQLIQTAQKVF